MSISLLAAAGSTLVAAVFTVLLALQCVRALRIGLVAWLWASAGITVALAAQALGFHAGFTPGTFRAVQLGAQLVAPVALVWGLAEVSARHVGARFAARLGLAALTVIAGVVMATDPLGGPAFSRAWPSASQYYQILPDTALNLIAVVTVATALIALIMAGVRSRRDRAGRDMLVPVAAASVAALLTELLREPLPVKTAYPALCLVIVALAWFAGRGTGRVQIPAPRGGRGPEPDEGWDERGYPDDTGYGDLYGEEGGSFGDAGPDTGYGDLYRDDGPFGDAGPDTGYGDLYPDTGTFGAGVADTGYGLYRGTDTGFGDPVDGGNGARHTDGLAAAVETGDLMPVLDAFAPGALGGTAAGDTSQLYGQIAIYTLVEGQAEEFDRLANDVVAKVAAQEPDTLIYVMHAVPSAPMQRILYEVYRDETAFADHGRQPYVRQFHDVSQSYVLATNVIELGVRQAKVMPLADLPDPTARRDGPPRGRDGR